MAGTYPKHLKGPLTFTVGAAVTGGQLVAYDGTTGLIRPAVAADTAILGVAHADARPVLEAEAYPTTVYGAESVDVSVPGDEVAVGFFGVYELLADGAITVGDLVQPAAAGAVAKESGGQVVGRCIQSGGIASGETGAILLMLLGTYVAPAAP